MGVPNCSYEAHHLSSFDLQVVKVMAGIFTHWIEVYSFDNHLSISKQFVVNQVIVWWHRGQIHEYPIVIPSSSLLNHIKPFQTTTSSLAVTETYRNHVIRTWSTKMSFVLFDSPHVLAKKTCELTIMVYPGNYIHFGTIQKASMNHTMGVFIN